MKKSITEIITELKEQKDRSAWSRGVAGYAIEMAQSLEENINGGYIDADNIKTRADLESACLNGASDWSQSSWGGCFECYDGEIAARLCTPSELKKTRNGERRPNAREEWLDVQARALCQAFRRIYQLAL